MIPTVQFDEKRLIFLHGSDSSSQTYKAVLLRGLYPQIVVPDFTGPLDERMHQLELILGDKTGWTMVGSSLGGLMAALFTARHPKQVRRLILLAPPLVLPDFKEEVLWKIGVPCVIIHGTQDEVVPPDATKQEAERVFTDLRYIVVEDDHRLHKTAEELDWRELMD